MPSQITTKYRQSAPGKAKHRSPLAFCLLLDRADSSKAGGMAKVAELLGISMSDVMAVGDGGNDLSMLQAAGVSVAMGNAVPEVQAAATFVSTDAAQDGIAVALRHFGII